MSICILKYVDDEYVYIYMYIRVNTHAQPPQHDARPYRIYVRHDFNVNRYKYAYIHIYIHIFMCIHILKYIDIHVYMYMHLIMAMRARTLMPSCARDTLIHNATFFRTNRYRNSQKQKTERSFFEFSQDT